MHALPHGDVDVDRLALAVSTEVLEHVLSILTPIKVFTRLSIFNCSVWLGRIYDYFCI